MRKAEKYIYIVLGIILVVVIACSITYMMIVNNTKTETKEEENNNNETTEQEPTIEDGITLKDTYQSDDEMIQEYEVVLNGKRKMLTIVYTYQYDDELIAHQIEGKLNNLSLYNKMKRDEYDPTTGIVIHKYPKDELFNIESLRSDFNQDNFQIITGEDAKNYLVVFSEYIEAYQDGEDFNSNAYILNDNLEVISNIEDYDAYIPVTSNAFRLYNKDYNIVLEVENANPWYNDSICNDYFCHKIFKIENNKIYYLVAKIKNNYTESDYGTLEERVYTINNDELKYEVINTYKITEMGNMI